MFYEINYYEKKVKCIFTNKISTRIGRCNMQLDALHHITIMYIICM